MRIGSGWLVIPLLFAFLKTEAQLVETKVFTQLNMPIPDGNTAGLSDVQTINSRIAALTSVRVRLRIEGEFNGDLYGYLRHAQNGATNLCVLLNRAGRTLENESGYSDAGLDVIFDDAASGGNIHAYRTLVTPPKGTVLTGTWQPDGRLVDPEWVLDTSPATTALSGFSGMDPAGEWTLFVADLESGGASVAAGWSLELSGDPIEPIAHVFYNNSAWDGNNPGADSNDDHAIATDKAALRPGGVASFANYTSYSRGINGVMIDLALNGAPAADDFSFKVGDDAAPSGWTAAPAPSSITVRSGVGVAGMDRVTIIWADHAIQKQWLEITAEATPNTALRTDKVFYFGNSAGESGNSPMNARVDLADELNARNYPHSFLNLAHLDDPYDYDRNRRVDLADEMIARNNPSSFLSELKLIDLRGRDAVLHTPTAAEDHRPSVINIHRAEGGFSVAVARRGAKTPRLETTDNLASALWRVAGSTAVFDARSASWSWRVENSATAAQRFFRVSFAPDIPIQTNWKEQH